MPGFTPYGSTEYGVEDEGLAPPEEPVEEEPPEEEPKEEPKEEPPPTEEGTGGEAESEDELFAKISYGILEPLAAHDGQDGYPIRALCRAVGAMFDQVEVVRASRGVGSWQRPYSVDTAPTWLLPFLGLFVGE